MKESPVLRGFFYVLSAMETGNYLRQKIKNMRLQPDVEVKYRLVRIRPGKYNFSDFGTIDLREIDVKQADELYQKGFQFLELKEEKQEISKKTAPVQKEKSDTNKAKAVSNKPANDPELPDAKPLEIYALRRNITYLNKLLTLNWTDLSYNDKLVFDNSEKLFTEKKALFIENSDITREMQSLHAKMRTFTDPDPKFDEQRKGLIQKLADLDDQRAGNWKEIDHFEPLKTTSEESKLKEAIKQGEENQKTILRHRSFINRAEKIIPGMKTETETQRQKKQYKIDEVERRKKELIRLGSPYKK